MDKGNIRILIAGSGAIGLVFGGFLRKNGFDVTLLGRGRYLSTIRDKGLTIEGIWGRHHIAGFKTACHKDDMSGVFDAVIISVKSYDTEDMVREILPFIKDDTEVISFQNGIGNIEKIADAVGEKRTSGARIIFGAEIKTENEVAVTVYAEPVKIGAFKHDKYFMQEKRLQELVSFINSSGIPCEFTDNIHGYLWGKLLYNSSLNPLGAILKVKYGILIEMKDTRDIMDNIINEIFAVAEKKGERLLWKSADDYKALFYGKLVPATYNHRSSMFQDIERGKRTEIEAMNGIVSKYGVEFGIATPVNNTVYKMIKGIEESRRYIVTFK